MSDISIHSQRSGGFLSRYFEAAGNVWEKANDIEWNGVNAELSMTAEYNPFALPGVWLSLIGKEAKRLKGAESHIS